MDISDIVKLGTLRFLMALYLTGGVTAIVLSFVFNYNKEHIGVALVFGVALYFMIARTQKNQDMVEPTTPQIQRLHSTASRFTKLTSIVWLLLLAFSIIDFAYDRLDYTLNYPFFILVALSCLTIVVEIAYSRRMTRFSQYKILAQIIMTSILVGAAFQFLFPGPYGNDGPYHVGYVEEIVQNGTLKDYHGQYQNYPFYHVAISSIMITSGNELGISKAALLITQLAFPVFVYLIARRMSGHKPALIATMLCSFSPHLLQASYFYFAGGFSVIFFILVIYLVHGRSLGGESRRSTLVMVSFVAALLTHPLTPFIIVTMLAFTYLIESRRRASFGTLSKYTVLSMSLATFFWWTRTVGNESSLLMILVESIRNAFEMRDIGSVAETTLAQYRNYSDILLSDLGVTLMMALAVAGAFTFLRTSKHSFGRPNGFLKASALSMMTLLFIPIPYALALAYPMSLPDRWFPFIEVLSSVFAGITLWMCISLMTKRKIYKILVVMLTAVVVFFMVTTPIVNPNSSLYATSIAHRSSLTIAETAGMEYANEFGADSIHASSKYIFLDADALDPRLVSTYSSGLVVTRSYDMENGFFIASFSPSGRFIEIVKPDEQFLLFLESSDRVYDNGQVNFYFN